jgi:hypothetical protein
MNNLEENLNGTMKHNKDTLGGMILLEYRQSCNEYFNGV